MKRFFCAVLLAAALMLISMPALAEPTPAPTATAGAVVQITSADVVFRTQPVISASTRIRSFTRDELVTFLAFEGQDWAKVKDKDGVQGYCSKRYIKVISVPTPAPSPSPTPQFTPMPPITPSPTVIVTPKPIVKPKGAFIKKLSSIPPWVFAELLLALGVGAAVYYYKKY